MGKPYKISNDIPLPEQNNKVPLNELSVGESFLFPVKLRPMVQVMASKIKKRQGKVYEIHKVDASSVRVWRIV